MGALVLAAISASAIVGARSVRMERRTDREVPA
jgi:hypothetical protein